MLCLLVSVTDCLCLLVFVVSGWFVVVSVCCVRGFV